METTNKPNIFHETGGFIIQNLKKIDYRLVFKILLIFIFTIIIFGFSMLMSNIADYRNGIYLQNYSKIENIYSGNIRQSAPFLNSIGYDEIGGVTKEYQDLNSPVPSSLMQLYEYSNQDEVMYKKIAQKYSDNTHLIATVGRVKMQADFVKKGLSYQPSFKTQFITQYTLENKLNEPSAINFAFPFPQNTEYAEISNAVLKVDGKNIPNSKAKVWAQGSQVNGLKWDGEIPANGQIVVEVSYDTVGLDRFLYQGFENSTGAQDFNFEVLIEGTRSYDVLSGLSVDQREFGSKSVKLVWNKPSLYTNPSLEVAIGQKLNPSTQVARVYQTLSPLYFIFMIIVLFLSTKLSKRFEVIDIILNSILFVVYFPLLHYLSSFTIDPTMELFASLPNVGYFSMPLYAAFAIAWILIGSIMYYLQGKTAGFGFSTQYILPLLILFLGFFPLVITIPEYALLLVLIGVVGFMGVVVQIRTRWLKV